MNKSRFDELVRSSRKDIKLEEVLAELLIDDAPVHFLDSGFGNRHFQRHQRNVEATEMTPEQYFQSLPRSPFAVDVVDYEDGTENYFWSWGHNLYHWLCERVEYDHEKTRKFYNFIDFMYSYHSEGWWPVRGVAEGDKKYLDMLHQVRFAHYTYDVPQNSAEVAGFFMHYIHPTWRHMKTKWEEQPRERLEKEMQRILAWIAKHPDGDEDVASEYYHVGPGTEHMLSQTFESAQWNTGDWCEGWGAAISIHQGADLRGGYSAVLFVKSGGRRCEWELNDAAEGTLYCMNTECNAYWDFDNCGNDEISNSGENGGTDVQPFPPKTEWGELIVRDAEGKPTGEMLCPCCKTGHLEGGF